MWRRRVKVDDEKERVVRDPVKSRERTMNRAVTLLAAKPRSIAELRARLLEKSWTNAGIVDDVIGKLKEYGYLDDAQFARDVALSKLKQKPQGKRRLQQAMSRKMLDRETVDEAIKDAFEALPEDRLIDAAIEKRVRLKGTPETREETQKFFEHLMRQGFDYDLIRDKLARLSIPDE